MPLAEERTVCKTKRLVRLWNERTERKVEIKKSEKASLDSRRPVFFMLGLVMALATLYVALEFNTSSGNMSGDASQFDDMQDLDLMPALDRSDMIAAAPSGAPAKPTPKNVKVVDEVKKQLERNVTINTLRDAQGEGEGGANGEQVSDDEETTKALSPVAVDKDENPLKLRVVQQLPEFPGGMSAYVKWLTKNLKYPLAAQKQKIEGRVVVSFVINRDGSLTDIKVSKSANPILDSEALRVAKMMPKWKPGLNNNKPCRTLFAVPIDFKL